jgi:hypothetical protein
MTHGSVIQAGPEGDGRVRHAEVFVKHHRHRYHQRVRQAFREIERRHPTPRRSFFYGGHLRGRILRRAAHERKLFFVFIAALARHNRGVIGAFLNAFGILLGALLGLVGRRPLSARAEYRIKSALGAFIAFCGLQLVWQNVSGAFLPVVKQLFLAGLAVVLGSLLGKILGLQKISNRLGRQAAALLAAGELPSARPVAGFLAATILFCAAPLGILGAVTDGLGGYFYRSR